MRSCDGLPTESDALADWTRAEVRSDRKSVVETHLSPRKPKNNPPPSVVRAPLPAYTLRVEDVPE